MLSFLKKKKLINGCVVTMNLVIPGKSKFQQMLKVVLPKSYKKLRWMGLIEAVNFSLLSSREYVFGTLFIRQTLLQNYYYYDNEDRNYKYNFVRK